MSKNRRKTIGLRRGGQVSPLSRVSGGGRGCIYIWSGDGGQVPQIDRHTGYRPLPPALPQHRKIMEMYACEHDQCLA